MSQGIVNYEEVVAQMYASITGEYKSAWKIRERGLFNIDGENGVVYTIATTPINGVSIFVAKPVWKIYYNPVLDAYLPEELKDVKYVAGELVTLSNTLRDLIIYVCTKEAEYGIFNFSLGFEQLN